MPYLGYVAERYAEPRARVCARVLRRATPGLAGPVPAWRTLLESLRWFASREVPGVPVTVASELETVRCTSDEEGYVEAVLRVPPSSGGSAVVRLEAPGASAAAEAVVPPDGPALVVSDIDDTALVSAVTRPLSMLRLALLGDPFEREVVPGMDDLLRALAGPQGVAFYVSTSPWNLYPRLVAILSRHRLPLGPLLLADWGVTRSKWITEPAIAYKTRTASRLLDDFPGRRVVLVGDSGQHDAEAYAQLARRHRDRVRAVLIRELDAGPGGRAEQVAEQVRRETAVPFVVGPADVLASAARDLGLVAR